MNSSCDNLLVLDLQEIHQIVAEELVLSPVRLDSRLVHDEQLLVVEIDAGIVSDATHHHVVLKDSLRPKEDIARYSRC